MREGLPKKAEGLVPTLNSYDGRWTALSAEPFSKMQYRVLFHIKSEETDWPWDITWEREPGSLHPRPSMPGSSPAVFGVKPYECQCCYNEDHSTAKCPLVDKAIDGFVIVPKRQADFVDGRPIPNSRTTEVWPPVRAPPPPPPPAPRGQKRNADWSNDEGTRKRLRLDVDTPAMNTPKGGEAPIPWDTPITARVMQSVRHSVKNIATITQTMEGLMEDPKEGESDEGSEDEAGDTLMAPSSPTARYSATQGPPVTSFPSPPPPPPRKKPSGSVVSTMSTPRATPLSLTPSADEVVRSETVRQLSLKFPYLNEAAIEAYTTERVNKRGTMARSLEIIYSSYWYITKPHSGGFKDSVTEEQKATFRSMFELYVADKRWSDDAIRDALLGAK